MFSIADVLTDETKITPKITLDSLHSEIAEEERFFRELEKAKKVYFDWGAHWFYVLINPDGDKKDEKNWVNREPDSVLEKAGLWGITSADTVAKIGTLGVEVIIFNSTERGFPTEEKENEWLEKMKEFYPEVKASFYKKAK
jgi:hypothetical protein